MTTLLPNKNKSFTGCSKIIVDKILIKYIVSYLMKTCYIFLIGMTYLGIIYNK